MDRWGATLTAECWSLGGEGGEPADWWSRWATLELSHLLYEKGVLRPEID